MDAEWDVTDLVRRWLHSDDDESADGLLADVLDRLDAIPQRSAVVPTRRAKDVVTVGRLAIAVAAVAAVVIVAFVGQNPAPRGGVGGPSRSPSTQPTGTPTPTMTSVAKPLPARGRIEPGVYMIARPEAVIRFTLPSGWSTGAALGQPIPEAGTVHKEHASRAGDVSLTIDQDVARVKTDVCVGANETYVAVGPTAGDLTSALISQIESQPSEALRDPIRVEVGGYPATRFELTYPNECPGPEGRIIWDDGTGAGAGILKGGITIIDVIDVAGARVVISSGRRGTTASEDEELDAILASIRIERPVRSPAITIDPSFDIGPLPSGRYSQDLGRIRFSFDVAESLGWSLFDHISINRSIAGPQGAEAMVYWTTFPRGNAAEPCGPLAGLPGSASAADVASAVSRAPGTTITSGPANVTVAGRPATHVVLTVREDRGCDPGFFYRWSASSGGPLWPETDVGDTIRVWIVDVDGTPFFIAGETHRDLRPGAPVTEAQLAEFDAEIQKMIDSVRFE